MKEKIISAAKSDSHILNVVSFEVLNDRVASVIATPTAEFWAEYRETPGSIRALGRAPFKADNGEWVFETSVTVASDAGLEDNDQRYAALQAAEEQEFIDEAIAKTLTAARIRELAEEATFGAYSLSEAAAAQVLEAIQGVESKYYDEFKDAIELY